MTRKVYQTKRYKERTVKGGMCNNCHKPCARVFYVQGQSIQEMRIATACYDHLKDHRKRASHRRGKHVRTNGR